MRSRRLGLMSIIGVIVLLIAVAVVAWADPFRATGQPVPATLRAQAAEFGLRIGTAVNMGKLNVDAPYTGIIASQFSAVTPENVMKWDAIEPSQGTFDYAPADRLVAFARAHGQLVRGHVLLWHSQIPSWLTAGVADGTISDAQLMTIVHQHITSEVGHFKGKIWQWDVANEFFTETNPSSINSDDFWISHLGTGIIADAFQWAHAADPKALLFYNDFDIGGEDGSNAKSDAVYEFVRQLRAHGVPIGGVGDQGHLDTLYGFPAHLTQDLRRYAALGLKVAITEADVRTSVETTDASQTPTTPAGAVAQTNEYSQLLQACVTVKACVVFSVWGIDDADSWVPGVFAGEGYADIYDGNLQPKPAYTALLHDLTLAAHHAPHRGGTGA